MLAFTLATPSHAQSNTPIKIGVIAEAQAVAGSSIPQAAQLAADEINAAGGVNGVQIIIAAVVGGRRTILGAVLGALFLIAMSEALRPLGDLSNFVVFAMALVVVLLFPSGFFGLLTRTTESS